MESVKREPSPSSHQGPESLESCSIVSGNDQSHGIILFEQAKKIRVDKDRPSNCRAKSGWLFYVCGKRFAEYLDTLPVDLSNRCSFEWRTVDVAV